MKLSSSLAVGFLFSVVTSVAQADLVLDLAFDDSTTSKTGLTSGDTVLVDLFLTDTDASTPMTADGLITGGGRLSSAGTATVTQSAAALAGTNVGVPWLNITTPVAGQPVGTIASALTAAPFLSVVGQLTTTIHIARFTLDVIGAGGSSATITADALSTLVGNQTGPGTFADLDAVLTGGAGTFGSVSVSIAAGPAAVPEASTLFMAGLLGVGVLYQRRRKSQKSLNC